MHVYCAKKVIQKLKFFSLPSKSCGALLKAVKKGSKGSAAAAAGRWSHVT